MIGNKLEQSIIGIFESNLSETFSINSISKILNKAYPYINKKSKSLINEGVLGKINIGNSYQCYLNLKNDKAKIFLAMIEINKKESLLKNSPQIINVINELTQITAKFDIETALLYKKNIILIQRNIKNSEFEKKRISDYTLLTQQYNLILMSRKEFQDIFVNNEDLRKYHYVLINTENYVNIISEIYDILLKNKILGNSSLGNNPIGENFFDTNKKNSKSINKNSKSKKL
ncbi:MAG: hypothetical protein QXL18_04955 [Candidatus Woesearchaeota archaeon]